MIRDLTEDELALVSTAESERSSAVAAVLPRLDGLLARRPADDEDGGSGAPVWEEGDQRIIDVAAAWLLTPTVNADFWGALQVARDRIQQNIDIGSGYGRVDTETTDHAYVTGDVADGIFVGPGYLTNDSAWCRREVLLHEYFHYVVGLQHYYSATTTQEALDCPHHLAEFVYDLATGCTLGCGAITVCH